MLVALLLCTADVPSSQPSAEANWSFGGGASYNFTQSPYAPPAPPQLTMRLSFERRLARHLWLALQMFGSYEEQSGQTLYVSPAAATVDSRSWRYGGALGLRYVFNVAQLFELSPYLLAGAAYEAQDRRTAYADNTLTDSAFTGYSLRATVGLAIERVLIQGVSLRLYSNVASIGYSRVGGTTTVNGTPGEPVDSRGISAGLAFEPGIELRMRF